MKLKTKVITLYKGDKFMLKRKYKKIIVATLLTSSLISGFGGGVVSSLMADITGTPNQAYAYSDSFNPNKYGMRTETGWVTSKVKCVDNIPENATLEQLKKMSIKISPETHPQLFMENGMAPGTKTFNVGNMNLTDEIYYWSFYDEQFGIQRDMFIKILSMKETNESPKITKTYSSYYVTNGISEGGKIPATTCIVYNKSYYDFLKSETSTPTPEPKPDPTPTEKTYTSERIGGSDRYSTATAIAKKYSSAKVNAVVLTNGLNFPDALAGSTLAAKKNAPILLVGSSAQNTSTMDYIKKNLNSSGTIYVLGDTGVVSNSVVSQLKNYGFKNFQRLGGADRFDTNLSIVNALNVSKGTPIIVANSNSFADSLSISGIAGAKGMPIFLVNGSLRSDILSKIKSISPSKIYIVGGTVAVSPSVEAQLKSIGGVTRLGGADRYDTSVKIANQFKSSTTTALISSGLKFPDALAGSVLASKNNAPILLVRDNVTAQKKFIDNSSINKLFILGGTNAVSDSIVSQLKK